MKRSTILLASVITIAVAAGALRVRHEALRPKISLRAPAADPSGTWSLPTPHDYVTHPRVDPQEADHGPQRIISIAPSITEIVCALGLADRLVGRTPYCTYPPAVGSVTTIGGLADPNLEKIKSLAPDLILVTTNSRRLQGQLRQLDLPYVAIPHDTFEEVFDAIGQVGRLCQRPHTASGLIDAIRSDLDRLQQAAARQRHRRPRTLVALGPMPVPPQPVFVAGPGSFLDELLWRAGGRNAAVGLLRVSHGELPLEQVRVLDPEVILEFREDASPAQQIDLYRSWSEVGDLQAIRRQRVRTAGGLEWLSAGPRIAIELHRFIRVLAEFE